MIVLDTSSLIRFITNDDPQKAAKVKKLLEEETVEIPDVVYPELEYVLRGTYEKTRDDMVQIYAFLISHATDTGTIKTALSIYTKTSLDMADCIISSYSTGKHLASFDKDLLKTSANPYWK